MSEIDDILSALAGAPRESAALATLVSVEGSSYRRPGARLLVLSGGQRVGSISGGCLEEDIILRARTVLESGRPEIVTYDTTSENDVVWGVGLGCRGVVRIFIELIPALRPRWLSVLAENRRTRQSTVLSVVYSATSAISRGTHLADEVPKGGGEETFGEMISPPPSLFLFGAGDDARPVVRLARETGWRVTLVDARAEYATSARFPEADHIIVAPVEQLAGQLSLEADTCVVVMTHRFAEDLALLRILLSRPLAYLGVLGPRQRTDRLIAQLKDEKSMVCPETLQRMFAPVGLDLGSATPQTIALSIVAELHCCLQGRVPLHLRDRAAPIHG